MYNKAHLEIINFLYNITHLNTYYLFSRGISATYSTLYTKVGRNKKKPKKTKSCINPSHAIFAYHSSPQSSFSLLDALGIVDPTPVAAVVWLALAADAVEDDGVCLRAVVPIDPDCLFC